MKLNVRDYKNNDIMRILREYSGMNQTALSEQFKKSVRTIQRYESGEINIDFNTIRKICDLCDLSITIESKTNKKETKPKL